MIFKIDVYTWCYSIIYNIGLNFRFTRQNGDKEPEVENRKYGRGKCNRF